MATILQAAHRRQLLLFGLFPTGQQLRTQLYMHGSSKQRRAGRSNSAVSGHDQVAILDQIA
jgi:hypothetical protein